MRLRLLATLPAVGGVIASGLTVLPADPAQARASSCPWTTSHAPISSRVSAVMSKMTLDDKVRMVSGTRGRYVGNVAANGRLCIPALKLEDGPAGVGDEMTGVTQLPAPVAGAATFDPSLMRQYGAVVGAEERGKGANVNLGPMVNIVRDPRWGRAFETYGEDPYLAGQLAVADIRGVQSQGVLAQVKHWAVYNQETYRDTAADNAIVSDRTMHEIYMPQFQAAVQQGGAASVMCAYSMVNSAYACENRQLVSEVLKGQWNYPGFVTSDWGATHSAVPSAKAGLDMQMPDGTYFGAPLKAAVQHGPVPLSRLNDMVSRILTEMFRFGLFDHAQSGKPSSVVTTSQHASVARTVAEQGTVLLKNGGAAGHPALPLNTSKLHSIAVIGDNAGPETSAAANVKAPYLITPVKGITRRAGRRVTVRYARSEPAQAVRAAKSSDVAVVFGSDFESEGTDLHDIDLPYRQNQLISAVAAANPDTIVVLNSGSAVTMPWLDKVKGVLEAWYPGQEDGNAISSVLFGDTNPSGKLPVTFPKSGSGLPAATRQQWPGAAGKVRYSEGLDVGYRWYDAKGIAPVFPFGYGLSYTSFAFSHLVVTPAAANSRGQVTVSADISNTGDRPGADVAQLYVGDPAAVGEPPRQLKGFQKIWLAPGQAGQVSFQLKPEPAFACWDTAAQRWTVATGSYRIMVGDSSANLPLTGTVRVSR